MDEYIKMGLDRQTCENLIFHFTPEWIPLHRNLFWIFVIVFWWLGFLMIDSLVGL